VCVIVPDSTRSCPLPLLLSAVHQALTRRVTRLTVVVALGTHAGLPEAALAAHLGYRAEDMAVRNHEWWDRASFATVGTISEDRVGELSNGMLRHATEVRVNRGVLDHDVTLIVGPVFPHEVVGFSGATSTCSRGCRAASSSTCPTGSGP
jgi:nickel-dependent lactate racemase